MALDSVRSQKHVFEKSAYFLYHVEGELILANKAAQRNIYNMLKPIMAAGGDAPFIIITPMLRYVAGPCCESTEHLTNRSELSYLSNMMDGLEDVRRNFRSFLFSDNIRRAGVIIPSPIVEGLDPATVWGEDPVHPGGDYYTKLAKLTVDQLEKVIGKRRRSEEEDQSAGLGREWTNFSGAREPGAGGGWRGSRGGSGRFQRGTRPYGGRGGGWRGGDRRSGGDI